MTLTSIYNKKKSLLITYNCQQFVNGISYGIIFAAAFEEEEQSTDDRILCRCSKGMCEYWKFQLPYGYNR